MFANTKGLLGLENTDYSEDSPNKAVEAMKNALSYRKAAIQFGISRATMTRAVSGKSITIGRPYVLPVDEQQKLAECVSMAGEWGFLFIVFNIRLIVRDQEVERRPNHGSKTICQV